MRSRPNSNTTDVSRTKEEKEDSTVRKVAREFGEMSLMHGIHFITNQKATMAERYTTL